MAMQQTADEVAPDAAVVVDAIPSGAMDNDSSSHRESTSSSSKPSGEAADGTLPPKATSDSDNGSLTPSTSETTSERASQPQPAAPSLLANLTSVLRRRGSANSSASSTTTNDESSEMTTSELEAGSGAPAESAPAARPSASRTGTTSSFPPTKDNSLRIFFPTDDLALKAILSPPSLRGGAAAQPPPPLQSTQHQSQQQQPAPANNGGGAGKTVADSLLEQTSRLFFLRGTSSSSVNNNNNSGAASSKAPPLPSTGAAAAATPTASMAMEEDLERLNDVVVMHANLPPPPFANMFACEGCHEDIGSLLTQGRHHCRNCGGSFCAACSSKTITVPYQLYLNKGEQRVCDGCFNRIRDFHAQAQTTDVTWCGLQPPSAERFVQDFGLPWAESPVTIFNCSYFVDFAPFYGHLFLTREHVCFQGYKAHRIKIPFADLHSLVKPEFYYINALQLNTRSTRAKHFFAEFNGLRDLCFLRLDQLVRAYKDASKKQSTSPTPEDLAHQALARRRSYKLVVQHVSSQSQRNRQASEDLATFIASSTTGCLDVDAEDDDDELDDDDDGRQSCVTTEEREEDSASAESDDEAPFVPLTPDQPVLKMTLLLDCELRADVRVVFEELWGDGPGQEFLRRAMEQSQDIDIDIGPWKPIDSATEDVASGVVISKETDYEQFRFVRSQHPPKTKFPGLPPYASCSRTQRLRVERSKDGGQWNRFVISDLHRMTKIPFSDYFEIETRWVFTRDGKNYCHVQAGLIVHFLKSTWFKSQINSSTMTESKEVFEDWAKLAILRLKDLPSTSTSVAKSPTVTATTTSKPPVASPATMEATTKPRRRASSSTSSSTSSATRRSSTSLRKPEVEGKETKTASVSPASVPTPSPGNAAELHASVAKTTTLESAWALWSSVPPMQWLTLLLLVYCLVLIRHQQSRLQQLTDTTALLVERLQSQPPTAASATMARSPHPHDACAQSILDGALEALSQFFANAARYA